jgi:cytochrome P450
METTNTNTEQEKSNKLNRAFSFLGLSNLTKFMADPVCFIQSYADSGPEIQSCRMGPKNFVFVFSPEAAQEVLVKRATTYVQNRTIFDRIKPVTGKKGLVQLAGRESQEARAKTRPMFTKNPMEEARELIETYTGELLTKIGDMATVDVTETMTDLILRTALRIFLGIDSEAMVAAIGPKFLRLNHLCGLRMRSLLPMPLAVPTTENREIRILEQEIREILIQHVAKHAKDHTEETSTVPQVFRDDTAVIDHCMTFLFAGHETTAASLAFTLLLLAQNPSYQDAIATGDADLTLAVYKESLRLYPPAYMLARESVADDELLGFKVKKSDQVFIGISSMHRNEKFFERPDDFYPERFLTKLKHPFAFIPFGAGGKSCVGERLAYLEATVILKMICQKYRIMPKVEKILIEPMITLHPPKGQHVHLEIRRSEGRDA